MHISACGRHWARTFRRAGAEATLGTRISSSSSSGDTHKFKMSDCPMLDGYWIHDARRISLLDFSRASTFDFRGYPISDSCWIFDARS